MKYDIAVAIIEEKDATLKAHDYIHSLNEAAQEEYKQRIMDCAKKYYDELVALDVVV